MRMNEGIDKIKVILHPLLINPKKIHFNKDHIMHIHPLNHITLHEGGAQVCLAIHNEFLLPFGDMKLNIVNAIYYLMEKEILIIASDLIPKPFIFTIIYNNLSSFIIHIPQLEFFFNLKEENIIVKEEAVIFSYLRKIINKRTGSVSYYTNDYRNYRNSMGIIYHKADKDLHDNHKKNAQIVNNLYKMRLEFRLNNINCNRLSLDNLKGTYADIINRFIPFLAIKYNELFADHVKINPVDNWYLTKLLATAKENESKKRYTGKELKKKSVFPKEYLKPHQIEERERKSGVFMGDILGKSANDKSSKKMVKIEEEMAKNGLI